MMHSPWTAELRTKEKESTTTRAKESTTKEKERHNGTTKEKDTQDTVNKDTKAKVQHRLDMAIPSREQCSTKERAKEKDHHHGKVQP